MAGDGVDIDLYDNLEEGFDQVNFVIQQIYDLRCYYIYFIGNFEKRCYSFTLHFFLLPVQAAKRDHCISVYLQNQAFINDKFNKFELINHLSCFVTTRKHVIDTK